MLCKKFDCEHNENNKCKCDYVSIGVDGECETYVSVIAAHVDSLNSFLDIKPFRMEEDE